jgi:hypothetical protein
MLIPTSVKKKNLVELNLKIVQSTEKYMQEQEDEARN